jgi:hypothetical protein
MMKLVFSVLMVGLCMSATTANAALVSISDYFKGTNTPGNYTASAGSVQQITNGIPSDWTPPTTDWINNSGLGDANSGAGTVTYTTTFSLPANTGGGNPIPIVPFSFQVAADNNVVVRVNGVEVANLTNAYTFLTTINPTLISGSNTITFEVTNTIPSPAGLLVTNVQGTYDTEMVIPEPASMALWGGILGIGVLARRRRKM